jgi:hypothetical protein
MRSRIPSKPLSIAKAIAASFTGVVSKSALLMGFAAGMAGCGGGGGGGGAVRPDNSQVPFTSFQAIQPNQTVVMTSSVSQVTNGTMDGSGTVTSASLGLAASGANISTVNLSYDPLLALKGASITTPPSSVSFSAPGDSVTCDSGVCLLSNSTAVAILIDGRAVDWNYQTFGLWATTPTATTWVTGAISAGNPTPASAVPATGSATFTGLAAGFYVDTTGAISGTTANMTANADFTTRSIGFATSGTMVSPASGPTISNPGLDLAGNLTYVSGSNIFNGPIKTSDNTLSGTATGQFYGPNAQEIGGTYGLTGSGVSGMLGAFGGKQ